jgi:hypothetical protein
MEYSYQQIRSFIKEKDMAKFYFFTDGCGKYPAEIMDRIE